MAGDSAGDRRLTSVIYYRCKQFEYLLIKSPLRGRFYLGRQSAPQANYFLLRGQKKVIKEKAAPTVWPCGLPCAPRHFGRARNSLRSNSRALLPKMTAVLGCTDGDPGRWTEASNEHQNMTSLPPQGFMPFRVEGQDGGGVGFIKTPSPP